MKLSEFVAQKIQKNITISEEDLKEVLNNYDDIVSDYNAIKEELIEDWRIQSYIVDYVDFDKLAQDDGFIKVNNDTYIRKWTFESFCKDIKNKDINKGVI